MKIMLKRNLLDRMVVRFTTTYAISAYHYWCCEFKSWSGQCVQHYVIVCQWRVTGQWFSLGPPVSSINKTDCHDKAEILLKGALNTIKTNKQKYNLLHFVLKLLIYNIYIWFRCMLHVINGLIDRLKFVKVMRNSFCQWLMQLVN